MRRAASADLSRLADAVLARVKEDRGPAKVVELRVWGAEMWRAHRTGIFAAGGLAAAACLTIVAMLTPLRGGGGRPAPILLADARSLTTLEQIDFESHEGAVLQSGDTTVIWIDDDGPAVPQ